MQGAERDVIIVSCCRTDKLGFIVSPRRLNVALTRAKHHLIVVGHRATLGSNKVRALSVGCVPRSVRLSAFLIEAFRLSLANVVLHCPLLQVWKSVVDTAAKVPGGIRGTGKRPLLLSSDPGEDVQEWE